VDERCWYAGTPETDRFKANDSGQALLVELDGAGGLPRVTPIACGQYRWQIETLTLQVPSDVDQAVERIAAYGPFDVVQLEVSGQTDLAGHRRLPTPSARPAARPAACSPICPRCASNPPTRHRRPQADGYLGEVLAELRAGQDGPDGEVARDALALLAGLLDERRSAAR
jgi:hypothetical protein